jgi:hypothetical protein
MPAVERVKLRMKIGVHELEAEGPRDVVMAQLDIWTRLAGLPPAAAADRVAGDGDPALRSLFTVDAAQQLITLRASLNGQHRNADAALLLLYGYQTCLGGNGEAEVPAARLRAALAASGHRLKRPDRALTPHLIAGLVRKGGRHKHETYALTTPGSQRAAALVRRLAPSR